MSVYAWKIALFCVLGGLCFTGAALGTGHFGWWWLEGVIMAAALGAVVRFGPRNAWAQFGIMAAVLVIVGMACTISEALLFFPEMRKTLVQSLIGGSALYVI